MSTDKSAAAVRELVERWMGKKHPITMQSYVSDLTTLISEHYYPEEFVGWCIGMIAVTDDLKDLPLLGDVSELYQYYKENVRC